MTENHQHVISSHIRRVYRRRLLSPVLYFILLLLVWLLFPLSDILFPQNLDSLETLNTGSHPHSSYLKAELKDLYFTGYTNTFFGQTNGYYYYTLEGKQCLIVLLSPRTCQEGLPHIDSVRIRGRILEGTESYAALLEHLASDLNWSKEGISRKVSPVFLSEPAFKMELTAFLMAVYFLTGLYALIRFFLDILYISFPVLCPACRQLGRYGKASALLAQAETEFATLPQLATEDMFITEHYFIVLANYRTVIVPIAEMLWIYKYSTLHKLLWRHFSISYTLHITASKRLYIQCPKNMKSDIDGIIDYLSEANHDILVGFSEENRVNVRKLQNHRLNIEKLPAFLRNKIKK